MKSIIFNYSEILSGLKSNNTIPYVQSTLLAGRQFKKLNEDIEELNRRLEALCQKEGLVFIDLNKSLAKDGILDKSYSNDGIHLNGIGYLLWKSQIQDFID